MGWQDDPIIEAKPKWESDKLVAPGGSDRAPTPPKPALVLKAGAVPPRILTASDNPYSAGYFPLGRRYSVGDVATFRRSDLLTEVMQRDFTYRVTNVDVENDRVEINKGTQIWDLMGNVLSTPGSTAAAGNDDMAEPPRQYWPAELQVGKKWSAAYEVEIASDPRSVNIDFRIVSREKVRVPAGEFHAFKVVATGWRDWRNKPDWRSRIEMSIWLLPSLNFQVKRTHSERNHFGRYWVSNLDELVSLRQLVFEV